MALRERARACARGRRICTAIVGTTVLLGAAAAPTALTAQGAPAAKKATQAALDFSIPAGPLSGAIVAFSNATGINIVSAGVIPTTAQSSGVNGTFTPTQALSQLLAGTGYTFRFSSSNSVTIVDPNTDNAGATVEGAIALDTIDVSGSASASAAADEPYQTPGSSAYVSAEQIQRVPPTSVGDMFRNTPGVISSGNRNGQSLDLNIRGLQGMGRVATLVDGAQQTSSTYRGYKGHSSRSFVDSELIGGIDIEKGPGSGQYGAGAMGGVVNMRTLEASDLVDEGKTFGGRIRGWMGGNTIDPLEGASVQRFDGNDLLSGENRMASIAAAATTKNVDIVAAFAHRENGNYFAGKNGDSMVPLKNPNEGAATMYPLSLYKPGGEVLNTSQETDSALLKGKIRFDDGQSVELGYIRYESRFGEEYGDANNPFSPWAYISEFPLSHVTSSIYTAKYAWKPADNPLVDFHADIWLSNVTDHWAAFSSLSDVVTKGGEVWNTSRVDTALGALSLKYGGQYSFEDVDQEVLTGGYPNTDFTGSRVLASTFAKGALDLTSWLTVSGGLRYEYYQTKDAEPVKSNRTNPVPEKDDTRVNPHAEITIKPLDGIQLFATYAEGWRPPSIREAMINMPYLLTPNPYLRPETSRNYEVGANLIRDDVFNDGDRLRAKIAYFDNNYEDYITRQWQYDVSGSPTTRIFGNIPSAHFNGVELSASYDAVTFFADGNLSYYTNVKYCDPTRNWRNVECAEFTSGVSLGYYSTYVPPKYAGSLTLGARLLDQKLTLGARMTFAGNRAIGRKDVSSSTTDSDWNPYQVYDVFGTYNVDERLSFNASVENLFDLYYLDALSTALVPSPGRMMRLGTTLKF